MQGGGGGEGTGRRRGRGNHNQGLLCEKNIFSESLKNMQVRPLAGQCVESSLHKDELLLSGIVCEI